MSRISDDRRFRALIPAIGFAGMLAGCSTPEFYLDRRETISFGAGDAIAANIAAQTVDPWPRAAGNRNIASDGERMQAAVERYRQNKVTPLRSLSTSSVVFSQTDPGSTPPATSK
jgi:type IV pilus biogenesis protein CpaD/CtpE